MTYNMICGADGPAAAWTAAGIKIGWNWINIFQLIIVLLLLAPNIVYALKCRDVNLCENRFMNVVEQIGRYGSMFFMIVCLGERGEFGFFSGLDFLIYRIGAGVLITAYWSSWICYFRVLGVSLFAKRGAVAVFVAGQKQVRRGAALKWALAALPCGVFLLCAVTLRYMPLFIFAVIFAVGHIFVTGQNMMKSIHIQDTGEENDVL